MITKICLFGACVCMPGVHVFACVYVLKYMGEYSRVHTYILRPEIEIKCVSQWFFSFIY